MDPEYEKYLEKIINEQDFKIKDLADQLSNSNNWQYNTYRYDEFEPESDPNSISSKVARSTVAISINKSGDLDILECENQRDQRLTPKEAISLISKIVTNCSVPNALKLFESSLEKEVVEYCYSLFEKWGITKKKQKKKKIYKDWGADEGSKVNQKV